MRHSKRPPIAVSRIRPNAVTNHSGEKRTAVCPDCDTWRVVERSMIRPHRTPEGRARCPGSGQRLHFDVTPEKWQAGLYEAQQAARRPAR